MNNTFNSSVQDPYELRVQEKLNKIFPDIYEGIEGIVKLQEHIAFKVLTILVEYACIGQNTTPIVLARNKIKKIPSDWLVQHFPKVIQSSINVEDEWEYSRLMELIIETAPQLVQDYVELGLASINEEVREAAEDIAKMFSRESNATDL